MNRKIEKRKWPVPGGGFHYQIDLHDFDPEARGGESPAELLTVAELLAVVGDAFPTVPLGQITVAGATEYGDFTWVEIGHTSAVPLSSDADFVDEEARETGRRSAAEAERQRQNDEADKRAAEFDLFGDKETRPDDPGNKGADPGGKAS